MIEFDKIPQSSKIAIYGAGEAGLCVKNYIENSRSDLKIVYFFDEKIKGKINEIEIKHIKDIQKFANSFDFIIPASFSNSFLMESILKHYGIQNCIRLNEIPKTNNEFKNNEPRLNIVKNILHSEESKKIFELVFNAYINSNNGVYLFEYLKNFNEQKFHSKGQYFDFIVHEKIKTVISGGAAEAYTTTAFLNSFNNLKKIYAFEPIYQSFKIEQNDLFLKNSGKVEIIEKGLFDKSTVTNFLLNKASSRISQHFPSELTQEIEIVSIDEFVKQKNIEKVDFIKMDIEGAELMALKGAKETLKKHRPQLAICIYHSYDDLFEIPIYLDGLLEKYKFEVYHYSPNTNLETVLYAIPKELNSER
ncbi:MAG TPA: FkbM family methyltransferase [Candidatus Gastranaerophilaceae bacterium]|nr:FkbM family methyltransferase [Candidatus Gastranaerophilaceae bacterium]HPT41217.1 FkbM family methyltransferase [Candidatus Gastranaerophilaceae bacterium]